MEIGRMHTLKKMLAGVLLLLTLAFACAVPVQAEEDAASQIILTIGSADMMVDGETVSVSDAVPVNNNGRVYVPLRAVAEGFGAEVNYDGATGDVVIENENAEIIMNTLSNMYTVDGSLKWMDIAPYVNAEGRTMVPVRFVSDGLDYGIETARDEATNVITTVTISRNAA